MTRRPVTPVSDSGMTRIQVPKGQERPGDISVFSSSEVPLDENLCLTGQSGKKYPLAELEGWQFYRDVPVSGDSQDSAIGTGPGVSGEGVVVTFRAYPIATAPKDRYIVVLNSGSWCEAMWIDSLWSDPITYGKTPRIRYLAPTHWAEIADMVPKEDTTVLVTTKEGQL